MITFLCVAAGVNFVWGAINFALLVRHTLRKTRDNREMLALLARAAERDSQMWDLLAIVKERQENERINRKEATIAKQDIGAKVDAATGELVHRIEEVPALVARELKSDSGIHQRPRPDPLAGT